MTLGHRSRRAESDQVQFAPIQQFPLHLITGMEADGGGQGQRKTHIQPGLLSLRTNRLNFQGIGRRHFFRRVDRFCFHLVS